MPLDTTRMVLKGHLLHQDVKQYADLLTGAMTDQAVTLGSSLAVNGTANFQGPSNFNEDVSINTSNLTVNNGLTTLIGNLNFSPDDTYNIGAAGVGRPRNVRLTGTLYVGATNTLAIIPDTITSPFDLTIRTGANSPLKFNIGGVNTWLFDGPTGRFGPNVDNALDIGAAAANRPRDVFVGRNLVGGTGGRIQGDWSNAVLGNRTLVMNATPGDTAVMITPNGTGSTQLTLWSNSTDLNNAVYMGMYVSSTSMAIGAERTGTGAYVPLDFRAGNAGRLRIDPYGTVIVYNALTVGGGHIDMAGGPQLYVKGNGTLSVETQEWAFLTSKLGAALITNAYWDGTNWYHYDTSQAASELTTGNGGAAIYTAAAGADPVAWTQQMSIDPNQGLTLRLPLHTYDESTAPGTDVTITPTVWAPTPIPGVNPITVNVYRGAKVRVSLYCQHANSYAGYATTYLGVQMDGNNYNIMGWPSPTPSAPVWATGEVWITVSPGSHTFVATVTMTVNANFTRYAWYTGLRVEVFY